MGEVGRTDQFQHCESADDVIMSIVKGSTLARLLGLLHGSETVDSNPLDVLRPITPAPAKLNRRYSTFLHVTDH
jgi:hypothetical protein